MSQSKKGNILDVHILPTDLIELEEYPETHSCGCNDCSDLTVNLEEEKFSWLNRTIPYAISLIFAIIAAIIGLKDANKEFLSNVLFFIFLLASYGFSSYNVIIGFLRNLSLKTILDERF